MGVSNEHKFTKSTENLISLQWALQRFFEVSIFLTIKNTLFYFVLILFPKAIDLVCGYIFVWIDINKMYILIQETRQKEVVNFYHSSIGLPIQLCYILYLISCLFCMGLLQYIKVINTKIFSGTWGLGYATIYPLAWGTEKESALDLYFIFFVCRGTNCSSGGVTHSSFPVGDGVRTNWASATTWCHWTFPTCSQDTLSALTASIPLQFGLQNPNLALEVWYYQSFQRWKMLAVAEFPDTNVPPGLRALPVLCWKNLSLLSPLTSL